MAEHRTCNTCGKVLEDRQQRIRCMLDHGERAGKNMLEHNERPGKIPCVVCDKFLDNNFDVFCSKECNERWMKLPSKLGSEPSRFILRDGAVHMLSLPRNCYIDSIDKKTPSQLALEELKRKDSLARAALKRNKKIGKGHR